MPATAHSEVRAVPDLVSTRVRRLRFRDGSTREAAKPQAARGGFPVTPATLPSRGATIRDGSGRSGDGRRPRRSHDAARGRRRADATGARAAALAGAAGVGGAAG